MLRIRKVKALKGFKLRLTLTDGSIIERDVSHLIAGPVFKGIRNDPAVFAMVRAEGGTVVWPNGADLCPDVLIWGGAPPEDGQIPSFGRLLMSAPIRKADLPRRSRKPLRAAPLA